jgi:hypothetical protein
MHTRQDLDDPDAPVRAVNREFPSPGDGKPAR